MITEEKCTKYPSRYCRGHTRTYSWPPSRELKHDRDYHDIAGLRLRLWATMQYMHKVDIRTSTPPLLQLHRLLQSTTWLQLHDQVFHTKDGKRRVPCRPRGTSRGR